MLIFYYKIIFCIDSSPSPKRAPTKRRRRIVQQESSSSELEDVVILSQKRNEISGQIAPQVLRGRGNSSHDPEAVQEKGESLPKVAENRSSKGLNCKNLILNKNL